MTHLDLLQGALGPVEVASAPINGEPLGGGQSGADHGRDVTQRALHQSRAVDRVLHHVRPEHVRLNGELQDFSNFSSIANFSE